MDAPNTGALRLRVHQTDYLLHPGCLLFVWPGELHEILQNKGGLIGLQFSPLLLNELPDFAPFLHLFRNCHYISPESSPALAENIQAHIQHILKLQSAPGNFHDVEALICLLELFMELGKHIENTLARDIAQGSGNAGKTLEKINAACSFISQNCEQELTLETVAEHIGFSACYFSRVFKQTTHYNFVEYLTMQRVKRAQALLADSHIAITELAYQSGFKSISTFNRVFRQLRGCSPSEYRKYYLENIT
ncbi:MAG: helix-turn-helix transcriptional regulator [Roseburia sp.]|nr:helix-turn-helix transcriptional regulator [Roseburia sp.]